jgi:hypothetical protein
MPQKSSGRYTIHDIAHELGVSARTISRVMNNQAGVGKATRKRVEEFIREVNFHPHSGARSLRRQRLDCIGVAVTSPPNIIPVSNDVLTWLFFELNRIFNAGEFIGFDMNPPLREDQYDYARGVSEQRFGACVVAGPLRTGTRSFTVFTTRMPLHGAGRVWTLSGDQLRHGGLRRGRVPQHPLSN